MHQYSTDTERKAWVLYLGGLAAGITWLVNDPVITVVKPLISPHLSPSLAQGLNQNITIVTFGFVGVTLYTLYDAYLWGFVARYSPFAEMPNLQGVWVRISDENGISEVVPDELEDEPASDDPPSLTIGHTWSQWEFGYLDEEEYWTSDSGAMNVRKGPHPEIICTYTSEPLSDSDSESDRGTIRLRYVQKGENEWLVGRRYSESGEKNGKMVFLRRDFSLLPPPKNKA
jgi:hypothetical protein